MSELAVAFASAISPLWAFEATGFSDEGRPAMRYNTLRQLKKTVSLHTFAIITKANFRARRAPDGPRLILTEEP